MERLKCYYVSMKLAPLPRQTDRQTDGQTPPNSTQLYRDRSQVYILFCA